MVFGPPRDCHSSPCIARGFVIASSPGKYYDGVVYEELDVLPDVRAVPLINKLHCTRGGIILRTGELLMVNMTPYVHLHQAHTPPDPETGYGFPADEYGPGELIVLTRQLHYQL